MTLDEALHYIHSVCWKGSVPGLERISALLDKMGHPERKLKFIHVTGTNGKGSTCAMLASMFTKAGYKTGLYTSPYLIRFNERIQIDGVQIPDEEICEITEYIKPLADSIFEQPTEFEMVTALGFEYFARHNCDLVVCEVGMGGEFDATNVILPPEVAIICNEVRHHQARLRRGHLPRNAVGRGRDRGAVQSGRREAPQGGLCRHPAHFPRSDRSGL